MSEVDLETAEDDSMLPLSALNHLLYCERRCALIHIEGIFVENVYTLEGTLAHQAADTPGYESAAGVRIVRALPLYSRRFRLTGKADIVEFRGGIPYPVDYKRGKRKKWANDDVQLCAQALCLEEMLGVAVPRGAVFHAQSKRRREVDFATPLRTQTTAAIERLHGLIASRSTPRAELKPQCEGCSLREVCLPELATFQAGAAEDLFFPGG
ncbi:MAG: CRISPR-associated protein Cas4 [Bryobacteraceae bacterium]